MADLLLFLLVYRASKREARPASVFLIYLNPNKIFTHRQQRKKVPKIIRCLEALNKPGFDPCSQKKGQIAIDQCLKGLNIEKHNLKDKINFAFST